MAEDEGFAFLPIREKLRKPPVFTLVDSRTAIGSNPSCPMIKRRTTPHGVVLLLGRG
jgi:hypothetical protein